MRPRFNPNTPFVGQPDTDPRGSGRPSRYPLGESRTSIDTVYQSPRPATEDGRVLFTALEVIGALRDVGVAISLKDYEAAYERLSHDHDWVAG